MAVAARQCFDWRNDSVASAKRQNARRMATTNRYDGDDTSGA